MKQNWLIASGIILVLLVFRIFLGIQINFSHEDYTQIFLIGLENATTGKWSYWGPDVVWSKTQIAGALQGLLIGLPLRLFNHHYAPIIVSNIISVLGLSLLAFYAKYRFKELSLFFLISLFLLLPFYLFHGTVLLNTAYLIFSGALLFISVSELFIYRHDMVLKRTSLYYFAIGFALLFTYQLHLTYVMFFPFICVLLFLEWKQSAKKIWKPILFLFIGCLVAGSTALPTFIKHYSLVFQNVEGNLVFIPERFVEVFDLMVRYFTFATFDIRHSNCIFKLAAEQSPITHILISFFKIFAILQFIAFGVAFYFNRKDKAFRKLFLLFILTTLLSLALYILSNKPLSIRTYILVYPIPIWLSLYAYKYFFRFKIAKYIMYGLLPLILITHIGVAATNYNDKYSFKSVEEKINKAIEDKNPEEFGKRRKTLMNSSQE